MQHVQCNTVAGARLLVRRRGVEEVGFFVCLGAWNVYTMTHYKVSACNTAREPTCLSADVVLRKLALSCRWVHLGAWQVYMMQH